MDLVRIQYELARALIDANVPVYDHLPDSVDLPAAFIGFPRPVEFDKTLRGGVHLEFEVFLLVGRAESRFAQVSLASACSLVDTRDSVAMVTQSGDPAGIYVTPIKPLLESHDSGGAWHSLHIHTFDQFGSFTVGSIVGLGVVFQGRMSIRGIPE